jgi:ATP-dependent protease Clp ATPase subunit
MQKCNFCGSFHVRYLVKGPEASICSECIDVAKDAVWRQRLAEYSTVRTWLSLTAVVGITALYIGGAI